MLRFTPLAITLALAATAGVLSLPALAAEPGRVGQTIIRNGEQAAIKGSDTIFTGTVRIDPLYSANNDMRSSGGSVTFEPGARSNWHIHPVGQVAGMGQADAGNQGRRHHYLPCGDQTLARRFPDHLHDPHLHLRRKGTRQGRGMDGARDRRAIQRPVIRRNLKEEQAAS